MRGILPAQDGRLPEWPTPDRELWALLASYDPHISSLALAVRDRILEEAPDARESFCNGYALSIAFSRTGKPLQDGFCHVVAYGGQ
jgi:hypothetical protein